MSLGIGGLPFLGFVVSGSITVRSHLSTLHHFRTMLTAIMISVHSMPFTFCTVSAKLSHPTTVSLLTTPIPIYTVRYHLEPRYRKNGGTLPPEARLEIGLMASIFIPISLFMFGWTSRPSVHW